MLHAVVLLYPIKGFDSPFASTEGTTKTLKFMQFSTSHHCIFHRSLMLVNQYLEIHDAKQTDNETAYHLEDQLMKLTFGGMIT